MSTIVPPAPPSRRRAVIITLVVLLVVSLLMLMGLRHGKETAAQAAIPTLTQSQEIALGQQAVPSLAALHGGLSADAAQQAMVSRVGQHIVATTDAAKAGWKFEFHLLAEPNTLDAYSLPGGQILITTALLNHFHTEGELAAVLSQQIAHVMARDVAHSLKAQGMTTVILGNGDTSQLVPEVVKFAFTPEQELKADTQALKLMSQAGYSPNAMLGLLRVLSDAYYAHADVAFFTTHPNAATRVKNIQDGIAGLYPTGVPKNLSQ